MNQDPIYQSSRQAFVKNVTDVVFNYDKEQGKPQLKIVWQGSPDAAGYKVYYRKRNANAWIESSAILLTDPAVIIQPAQPLEEGVMYEFKFVTMAAGGRETYPYYQGFMMPVEDPTPQVKVKATREGNTIILSFENGNDSDEYLVAFGDASQPISSYDVFKITGTKGVLFDAGSSEQMIIVNKVLKEFAIKYPPIILNAVCC